ncbi:hypothetical protein J6590_058592 [Homalodisca vitripennis]|nr:hypothetical protein J6590_058592 [Homalodisca vitripennis]
MRESQGKTVIGEDRKGKKERLLNGQKVVWSISLGPQLDCIVGWVVTAASLWLKVQSYLNTAEAESRSTYSRSLGANNVFGFIILVCVVNSNLGRDNEP